MVLGNPLQKCKGVAFVGVGDTDYGKLRREQDQLTEPRNAYSMGVSVARDAIRDANLTPEEIDGVLLVRDIRTTRSSAVSWGSKRRGWSTSWKAPAGSRAPRCSMRQWPS
jgi:hypothetical protein